MLKFPNECLFALFIFAERRNWLQKMEQHVLTNQSDNVLFLANQVHTDQDHVTWLTQPFSRVCHRTTYRVLIVLLRYFRWSTFAL